MLEGILFADADVEGEEHGELHEASPDAEVSLCTDLEPGTTSGLSSKKFLVLVAALELCAEDDPEAPFHWDVPNDVSEGKEEIGSFDT